MAALAAAASFGVGVSVRGAGSEQAAWLEDPAGFADRDERVGVVVQRVEQGHRVHRPVGGRQAATVGTGGRARGEGEHRGRGVDQQAAQAASGQQAGQPSIAAAHVENRSRACRGEPVGDVRVHVVARRLVGGQEAAGIGVVVVRQHAHPGQPGWPR